MTEKKTHPITDIREQKQKKAMNAALANVQEWAAGYCAANPETDFKSLLIGVLNGIITLDALQMGAKPKFHDDISKITKFNSTKTEVTTDAS